MILSWGIHLARQHPGRAAVVVLVTLAVCAVAYFAIGFVGCAAVFAVMTASTADFLFPTRYQITHSGASCHTLLKTSQILWSDVRRCYIDDFGIKLSPLDRTSRLEAFRGVYLRFGSTAGADPENLIKIIRSIREAQCQQ